MRVMALAEGRPPAFTIDGSIAIVLLGAITGVVIAALFLLSRALFPAHRILRATLFWTITAALVARGLHPLTVFKAVVFGPLFLAHGALLNAYWCRVHNSTPQRGLRPHAPAAAPPARATPA